MHSHSASERSVGYVFLMRARVANYYTTHPFRTVSLGTWVNKGKRKGRDFVPQPLQALEYERDPPGLSGEQPRGNLQFVTLRVWRD
jgi:hypothetical protein